MSAHISLYESRLVSLQESLLKTRAAIKSPEHKATVMNLSSN